MQECIATFDAETLDEAIAAYDEMYEGLAEAWEAKNLPERIDPDH